MQPTVTSPPTAWRRRSVCRSTPIRARSPHEWVKTTGAEMNEARLRMTRIPKGADLILNKVSGAPGFWDRQCNRDGGRALDHAGDAR